MTWFLLILAVGCDDKQNEMMLDRRSYTDGPHVFINDSGYQVLYFESDGGDQWKVTETSHQAAPRLSAGNPYFDDVELAFDKEIDLVPSRYPAPNKILLLSDIEGNYNAFVRLCQANEVVDGSGNWNFGEDHLVLLGDLQDRGSDVTPLLWHLYRLEQQARIAGGRVHVLLGNHEQMVFDGDHRYLHAKYQDIARDCQVEYATLFSRETLLGRWLRSKNAVITIGGLLLSHAGITPTVQELEMPLTALNALLRKTRMHGGLTASEQKTVNVLLGSAGPFWNRQWVEAPPKMTVLDKILSYYEADQMIIGHTLVSEMHTRYDGKLVLVDVDHRQSQGARALLIEGHAMYTVDQTGKRKVVSSVD
ncbi:MAG: metallophosphoesterase [Saprospiraceae bacterium]|nr:metallophosphoesterase [Saprospiraceae bacterium]